MMGGDRLHKHSWFFFLIGCFQGQKQPRQQKALNEQFYSTYKPQLVHDFFSSFLISSTHSLYFLYSGNPSHFRKKETSFAEVHYRRD